ncbi:RxLR effector protein [Phytophthora megakarya]|uniref:RxLR effector protein n=1 Tax=Phytophthora megakarya TaxID=4795 RepID=A0A225VI98_9STRA|nr:RxLR effector protein [Phytophthora megakarya]
MRLTNFLVVAVTGLLACSEAVAATPNTDKTIASELDQVLSDRQLIDNGKRFLRTAAKREAETEGKLEERDISLIQTSNIPRYHYWFDNEMTPHDVRIDLDLTGAWADFKVVKQSIYKGYVKYYDKNCEYSENEDEAFCKEKDY